MAKSACHVSLSSVPRFHSRGKELTPEGSPLSSPVTHNTLQYIKSKGGQKVRNEREQRNCLETRILKAKEARIAT